MTLQEAKENIGGLAILNMDPTPGAPPEVKAYFAYMQIIDVKDGRIYVFVEDLRDMPGLKLGRVMPGGPCGSLFHCVPGDGYAEALYLVEPPRTRRSHSTTEAAGD